MNNYTNTDTTYDIVCPFCFKRYTNVKALFIDHKTFTTEELPEHTEYMRYYLGQEVPPNERHPVFFPKDISDGLQNQFAGLTESGEVTYTRACPYCCNILPASAGKEKAFSITVIGAEDTERGVLIGTMLHRLNREMQAKFGGSLIPADLKTAETFFTHYDKPLYAENKAPDIPPAIEPLIYEFRRNGAQDAEEWKGNSVLYNRSLIYIYNISKKLTERYPMIAGSAIAQSSGIIYIADMSAVAAADDVSYDPWLGYITETLSRIFGAASIDRPTAVILNNSDKAGYADRKWMSLLKSVTAKRIENVFPTANYITISEKTAALLAKRVPAYYSALKALFSEENTLYFLSRALTEGSGSSIKPAADCSASLIAFQWMLSTLSILPEAAAKSFSIHNS